MTDSIRLSEPTAWVPQQADDDEQIKQSSLSTAGLLDGASDRELVAAYESSDGEGLLADVLLALIRLRGLDL